MNSKLLVVFSFTLLLFATTNKLKAQIDVTTNPVALLFRGVSISGDLVINKNFSLEAQLGYNNREIDDDGDYKSFPATVFGKYYLKPDLGADKFYISAFARYVNRSYDFSDESRIEYNQNRFGIGFGLGYKVVSNGGFVFDIGLGVGRALTDKTTVNNEELGEETIDWPEVMFAGKLAIGWRFRK